MRRLLSILFLSLMLLQAIPVLHFFSSQKEVFYALIDEEKPDDKPGLDKKEAKEYLSCLHISPSALVSVRCYVPYFTNLYAAPPLDAPTQPPNAC